MPARYRQSVDTTDPAVRPSAERVIARSRVALVAGSLIATYLDATEPQSLARAAYAVLAAYGLLAVIVVARAERLPALSERFVRGIYLCDFAFAGLLISLTAGPGSPLFPIFTFILASAAFRRGSREVYRATVVLTTLFVTVAVLAWLSTGVWLTSVNFLIVRVTFLLVMAFLLGYLADEERALRREASLTASALRRIRDAPTYSAALAATSDEFLRRFGAQRVIALFENTEGVDYAWSWTRDKNLPAERGLEGLTPDERDACRFPVPNGVEAWYSQQISNRAVPACPPITAMTGADEPATNPASAFDGPPQPFWDAVGCGSMMGTTITLEQEWHVRVYLLDPVYGPPPAALALFQFVTLQVAPAILNMFVVSRLRSQAARAERDRLSRELHDRVIQSLIGIELQLTALTKQHGGHETLPARIMAIRDSLRAEVLAVRELMHDLRPIEIAGTNLPAYLANVVGRFQRDTGIQATFSSDGAPVGMSTRRCGELARIVQEALVNVRKHSGATSVRVEFAVTSGGMVLRVEDDGRGFGFAGRLTDRELGAQHHGPTVIQQRVRRIGASLAIESRPGLGSRLEVVLPCVS